MRKIKTFDEKNYPIVVLLPDYLPDEQASEGIPISVDFREIYPNVDPVFLARFQETCAAMGLVTKEDFLAPAARPKIINAIRVVESYDASYIIEHLMKGT